jgi:TetR/AcrR family transcriptional regulator, ethionamide resistance regulator
VRMTIAGRRRGPSKGDLRERALLKAARTIFREKPLSEVTVDELAGAAGIARSGFYFYFESKQALLAALCEQVIGESFEDMALWLESDGPSRSALKAGLTPSLARWKVDGRWMREAFVNPDPGPELAAIREQYMERGRSAIAARIARDADGGIAQSGPPELLARMVITLHSSTFAHVYAEPEAHPDEVVLDTLVDAFLRVIYGQVDTSDDAAGEPLSAPVGLRPAARTPAGP